MSRVVILVVLLVLLATVNLVAADFNCKKLLRTVYLEKCHARSKRDNSPLVDSFADADADDDDDDDDGLPSEHRHAAKRQIMSIHEIFVASGMPVYQQHQRAPYPSSYASSHYPAVPASDFDYYRTRQQQQQQQQPPSRLGSLPQESHSEVGFDMSNEEMMELLEELYERMPRGTKSFDEMKNEYLPQFAECCKNVEVCRPKCPYK